MTDAVRALVSHGFENDIVRFETLVYATNPASSRVLEKAGFEREGVLRCAAVKRGEVLDAYLYGKVRP
jgi:RimJ/RimL family protein N-acetyltransferase